MPSDDAFSAMENRGGRHRNPEVGIMNRLMGAGGVVAPGVAEGVQFGHLHGVERGAVECAAAAVLDRGTRVRKEAFDGARRLRVLQDD
jgi:hypothetical protein